MKIVVLSGGVGGARFVRGLVDVAEPADVTVIGNVGDDLEVLGVHVSPDLDSILYALADLNDEERGWGRADETWNALTTVAELGGESWFRLGDRDLGLHLVRSQALQRGEPTIGRHCASGEGARARDRAHPGHRRSAADVDHDAGRRVHLPGVVRRAGSSRRGRCAAVRGCRLGDAGARRARGTGGRRPPACRAEQPLRLDRADSRARAGPHRARGASRALRRGEPADRRARGEGAC